MRRTRKNSKLKKLRNLKEKSFVRLNLKIQSYAQGYIALKKQNYDFIGSS